MIPNLISFLRIPLAFFFLSDNSFYRFTAIILAAISDCLDGYLARNFSMRTKLGTIIDPLADKFFVIFGLTVFIMEGRISAFEAAMMISRDFSVLLFGFYLFVTNKWQTYTFRSIWCGKVTTFFQFVVALSLTFGMTIPFYVYFLFLVLGFMALIELYLSFTSKESLV